VTDDAKFQFQILAEDYDRREVFYHNLQEFVTKKGYVPKKYEEDWRVWTSVEHRRTWRSRPLIINKLKKAAKMMAKMNRKK
jgi:hypothetical protein